MTTLLLPLSMSDTPAVPDGVRIVRYDLTAPLPADALDAEALVVWGNGHRQMSDAARRLTRLRWWQTLAAGPDSVLAAGFAPDVVITSGRGLHDGPVAEHTLALLLALLVGCPSSSARRTSTDGCTSSAASRTSGRASSSAASRVRAC